MAFQSHLQGKGYPVDDKDEQPNIDEFCCHLLDALFPSSGPFFWKGELVLRLKVPEKRGAGTKCKDVFEEQQQQVLLHGVHHRDSVSSPVLKHVTRELICCHSLTATSFLNSSELELHLRCIVASLRLLISHAGQDVVSRSLCEELYHGMSEWQQQLSETIKRTRDVLRNYNNDFLVLYAKDLIASMSSSKSVGAQVSAKMIAAMSSLDPMVHKVVLQADP
jgi:hypothetical protein